jgi:hypothetical protein
MSLQLVLNRVTNSDEMCIGEVYINEKFQCFTCEDTVRYPGIKIPGKTAIPAGAYEIFVTMSTRFQRMLPLLINVPMFEGIRIHPGNTALDTEGCILPGMIKTTNGVGSSRIAFEGLFQKINDARSRMTQVFITINNTFEA